MDREKDSMSKFLYYQPKGFFAVSSVIKNILFKEGLVATSQKILKHLSYKIKGIDFDFQSLDGLTIEGENQKLGTLCGSSNESTVKHLLDTLVEIDETILQGKFVDIGSGKGRLVIYAKKYGFLHTIGIEFAKELYAISMQNIKALKIKGVEIVYGDAVKYKLEKETRVIYFLNPFEALVFDKLLPKFIEQIKDFNKPIYFVYRVPIYKEVFNKYAELKHVKTVDFKGDKSEIYCFSPL
jgi:SAM-dependent methyltransferase